MPSQPRILILSAGFGEGHNSAAKGIFRAFEQSHPDAQLLFLDPLAECYGRLNNFARKTYLGTINRAPKVWQAVYDLINLTSLNGPQLAVLNKVQQYLQKVIQDFRPDVIVSTYPVYGYFLDRLPKPLRKTFQFFMVVTDSISINSIWYRCSSDWIIVPNQDTANVFKKHKVSPSIIRKFGFPVNPIFADLRAQNLRPPITPPYHILYMINSGKTEAPALVQKIAARKDVRLTVTSGRDESLQAALQKVTRNSAHPVEILGWTDQIPALMCSHHLLISKAGGATVQEALAAGCPLLITKVVPGQEEGNAELLRKTNAGIIAPKPSEVYHCLDQLLADQASRLRAQHEAIQAHSRPDAANQLAEFILTQLKQNTPTSP